MLTNGIYLSAICIHVACQYSVPSESLENEEEATFAAPLFPRRLLLV